VARKGNMPVPPKWAGQDKRFGETIKNNLDVLCGYTGDPLDRALTARDLLDSGIVKLAAGSSTFSGGSSGLAPTTTATTYATPPAPTSLSASGAFQNILLTWNLEIYTGHAYTEVFRYTSDSVADATLAGQVSGFNGIFSDAVGGGKTYFYWVRAVNQNGVAGPFNSSTGTQGQTQTDVAVLLDILTDQITSSELASSLSTPIATIPTLDGRIDGLDAYTGYTTTYSGANLLTRVGNTEATANTAASAATAASSAAATAQASANSAAASASSLSSTVSTLQSSVSSRNTSVDSSLSSLNTSVSNLQSSVSDLTSGTSSVYVQTSAPTGTIATNSRWYDSDDNMAPYYYDGSSWVSIADPRIASNQASITSLNSQVFNGDGSSRLATSSALTALDTTVVNLNGTVTSIAADVTSLEGEVFNSNGSARLATGAAVTSLTNTVTTQGNNISSAQTDITDLEGEVFNSDGSARLATGTALTGLTNTVSTQAGTITSIQTDVTALEGQVFNADGSAKLATGSALTGVTNSVTAIYDGTNASVVKSVQDDVTALEGEVFNSDGSARLATGTALSGLTNSVTAIYDGTNASVVKSVQTDITDLEGEVFNSDGSSRLATGSALSGLTNSVTAIYDGTNASVVKSVQTDVSALEGEVFNSDGSARLATGSALSGLTNSVTAIYDGTNASVVKTVQTDVTALEGEVFNSDGSARLATGSALTGVSNSVTAIYDGTNASVVKSVQDDVSTLNGAVFNADGTVAIATSAAISALSSEVEAIYNPENPSEVSVVKTIQSDITSLEGEVFNSDGSARLATGSALNTVSNSVTAIYDGGNASVVKSVQDDITDLNNSVFDSSGNVLLATTSALSGLTTSVEAIYNPDDPDAVSLVKTIQSDVTDLESAVFDSNGVVQLATQNSIDGLTTSIEAIYNPDNPNEASAVKSLQGRSTALEGAVFNGNQVKLATVDALDGLTNNVTAIYNPNDPDAVTQISAIQEKVTSLDAEVFNANDTSRLATGSALGALSNKVTAIYDDSTDPPSGLVTSVQSDVVDLNNAMFDSGGNVKLAGAGALSLLETEVWGNGVTPSGATSSRIDTLDATITNPTTGLTATSGAVSVLNTSVYGEGVTPQAGASKIDALSSAVFDENNNVKLADADAFSTLQTEVFGPDGNVSASRIDGLRAVLYDTDSNGNEQLALATAAQFGTLNATVNNSGALVDKVDNIAASMFVNSDTSGTLKLATSEAFDKVQTEVFPNGDSNASRVSQLSAALWDQGNPDNAVLLAGADFASKINLEVFGSETDQTGASKIDTLQVVVNGEDGTSGIKAAIETTQEIVGDSETGLSSQYSVKVDNQGHIAGFGLSNTSNDDGTPTSAFIVRADRFAIVNPQTTSTQVSNEPINDTQVLVPFTVEGEDIEDENGNVIVPAGVYMDGAFIKNGTITTAQIGNATIDTANITGQLNANRISGGKISTSLLNIDGVFLTSQDVNGVPTLTLGDISANKITSGTINAANITVENLRADQITGDINDLIPFSLSSAVAIDAPNGAEQVIFTGQIPAQADGVEKRAYISAEGWGVFENDDAYRLELWMKTNDTSSSTPSLGTVTNHGSQNYGFGYIIYWFEVAGDVTSLVSSGSALLVMGYTYGNTSSSGYTSSTDRTRIYYTRASTSTITTNMSVFGQILTNQYTMVNDFFFRSASDYHPYQFSISGGLGTKTSSAVDFEIRIGVYNANKYYVPSSQPYKNWVMDKIYALEGIAMSLR